ncbi:DNA adenine methyltransferase YhdJ [termite gut metagenome]|uniref:DNA adenine methyltransferase YhdJ n=1 Tax=termite gut metagenome TaxID=433724 RepID=A0A5J4SAD0_9ZZZZ
MTRDILYNEDCTLGISRIPSESIDCILTDPPYLYLKNQKLDKPFDEQTFFGEVERVLKKEGFIVLFGRGTSFYRWNTILADLGFNFKEEFIWDKGYCTSPLMPISRVHETISIHTKKSGTINKVKVPYLEMKRHDIDSIITDIKRLKTTFKNTKSLDAVLEFLENNKVVYDRKHTDGFASSYHKNSFMSVNVEASAIKAICNGMNEKSIIQTDRTDCETFTKYGISSDKRKTGDRCTNVVQSVQFGMNEKSIIRQSRDHYNTIHPTQKPVRLLERLLALTTKEGDTVLDPFAGSCSTAKACINSGRHYICYEIDKEYYENGKKRIDKILSEPKLI